MAAIRQSEEFKAVTKVLEEAGVPYILDEQGRHASVTWHLGGRRHRLPISRSGSDHRAALNARAQVRRMLRQPGAAA